MISSDSVVDVFQVARAKLAGAAGVTIRFALNSKDTTKQLIDTCFGLGMEPVVQVKRKLSLGCVGLRKMPRKVPDMGTSDALVSRGMLSCSCCLPRLRCVDRCAARRRRSRRRRWGHA